MLKWHDHYYVGESVRDESAVREKLDAGKPVPGIYLVTFRTTLITFWRSFRL